MKNIYCISGLGADEKAFARLRVDGYQFIHLPWLMPEPKEKIEQYAARMAALVKDEKPVLMGLSFGGIMSIEIAKQLQAEKVVLISSIKSAKEMPVWMRAAGKIKLNKIIPIHAHTKLLDPIQNRFMGVTNQKEKEMVRAYRANVPQVYLNWAIDKVLNWKNNWQPAALYHIHGDADRIFPVRNIAANYVIKNGGHFMIMNKSKEVNRYLADIFSPNQISA